MKYEATYLRFRQRDDCCRSRDSRTFRSPLYPPGNEEQRRAAVLQLHPIIRRHGFEKTDLLHVWRETIELP